MRVVRGKRDDTIAKCVSAYRIIDLKIGPALGIAICKSGFQFELFPAILGVSRSTLYGWVFGRCVPNKEKWIEISKTTRLLEIALDAGEIPIVDVLALNEEKRIYEHLANKHFSAVNKTIYKP